MPAGIDQSDWDSMSVEEELNVSSVRFGGLGALGTLGTARDEEWSKAGGEWLEGRIRAGRGKCSDISIVQVWHAPIF